MYFAKDLMTIFIDEKETEIIMEGVKYLKIEGAFYCGIGCLFLLYGLYRALGKPGMSVILTIFSLGTTCCVSLCFIRNSSDWCYWYLVVCSYWMGTCRFNRINLL